MSELIKCPTCKTDYEIQPETCHNCGYPFSGTDKEKSHFVAHQIMKKGKISDTKDSIKRSRNILFIIAAYNIIVPIFQYMNDPFGGIMIAFSAAVGLIFLFFGFMIKRHPFISILIPLILLSVFYLLDAFIDPASLIKGIVWKIVFIGSMVYSLVSINQSEKIKKESDHLATNDYK